MARKGVISLLGLCYSECGEENSPQLPDEGDERNEVSGKKPVGEVQFDGDGMNSQGRAGKCDGGDHVENGSDQGKLKDAHGIVTAGGGDGSDTGQAGADGD